MKRENRTTMKNSLLKSLIFASMCLLSSVASYATTAVAIGPGTYDMTSAVATSGSKKFQMYNNIYYGRSGGGLTISGGLEVKSGSMLAFKLSVASTVKFYVMNSKQKSITDEWDVKAISDADFDGIIAQFDNQGTASTYYTNNGSTICSLSVTHGDKNSSNVKTYTNESTVLQPGCYGFYLSNHSADGDFIVNITIAATGPVISSDATLSALTYNGTSVQGFAAGTLNYDVELPAGTVQVPTVSATANESHAIVAVTQAAGLPGTASVLVTAEDGTTTKTYTVTFTVASNAPSLTSFTLVGRNGVIDQVNKTVQLTVPNGTDVTSLTPTLTGKNMESYSPTGAVDFTNPVQFTLTSSTSETAVYIVTVTVAPPMSSDATLGSLKYNGTMVPGFTPGTLSYNIEMPAGTTTPPTVSATANDSKATAVVTQASSMPGAATVKVTAEDGTTQTYSVNFTVALPSSNLTCHETEIYESQDGYNTPLSTYNGREYEVYYVTRDGSSNNIIATQAIDKTGGISSSGDSPLTANDGWFNLEYSGSGSDSGGAKDEYAGYVRRVNLLNNMELTLRIKGYDQFSFIGADNNSDASKGKHFEVYIDGIKQSDIISTDFTVRRYDISTLEHIITVRGIGGSNNKFAGFSLRVAYVPKLKLIAGNDTTQTILQTDKLRKITYYLKNRISDAELTWNGAVANGIVLQKGTNDTIFLTGNAMCSNGVYNYAIIAKDNSNNIVSEKRGKFTVSSIIKAITDTDAVVYEKSSIQPLTFKYYSISDGNVSWQWTGGTPTGLTFTQDTSANTVTISGVPTTIGTYTYSVTLAGANTVKGTITVESKSPKVVPGADKTMLYLYKNDKSGGLLPYLQTKYNWFARPAGGAMQNQSEYSEYDFVVISEDVDADNAEVLSVIRELKKPVLNMKIFAYTPSRLNWGDPDNGSLGRTTIAVRQPSHPIFNHLSTDSIRVISAVAGRKGLMAATVNVQGGMCLASAAIRGENYTDDGEEAVFIHEIPESVRGAKYLTLPIGQASAANLTSDGKTLVSNMITYLCAADNFVSKPELRITRFVINDVSGTINDSEETINIVLPQGTDLTALKPTITLADISTIVTPHSGEIVDMSDSHYGVRFTVSDMVNKKTYVAKATIAASLDDVNDEDIWYAGQTLHNPNSAWVNIYNVNGAFITTTNSDYDFSAMPRGMYLIITPTGNTLKIVR